LIDHTELPDILAGSELV